MPAYVFADGEQSPVRVEQARGVNAAGTGEIRLRGRSPWQTVNHLGRESGFTGGDRVPARHRHGSDRPLAAARQLEETNQ